MTGVLLTSGLLHMNIQKTISILAFAGIAVVPFSTQAAYGVDTSIDAEVNVGVGATTSPDTGTSSDASLTGGLNTNTSGIEVMSASQVTSDADLSVFSENLIVRDPNVVEANASAAGSADLAYYHHGRLFGFIPVKVKARTWVTTDTDGNVSVNTTMPWWSGLVAGTGNIRTDVDTSLESSASVSADIRASADAKARARILEAIADAHADLDTYVQVKGE